MCAYDGWACSIEMHASQLEIFKLVKKILSLNFETPIKAYQSFFKGFCDVTKMVFIQKKNSQIWLHTIYESKNKGSFYILGCLLELIIKI